MRGPGRGGVGGLWLSALCACVAPEGELSLELGGLEAPESVALGRTQVGAPLEATFTVSNPGPGATHLTRVVLGPGATADGYRFEAELADQWLRPGERATVTVRFDPILDTGGAVAVVAVVETDTADPDRPEEKQRAEVRITASALRYGLEVTPNPVDFGLVGPGAARALDVRLENRLDVPVQAYVAAHAEGRSVLTARVGEGALTVAAPVGPGGRLHPDRPPLEPGEVRVVPMRFAAPGIGLGGETSAVWSVAGCDDPVCVQPVPLRGETSNEALRCAPEAVDLGAVFPGGFARATVRCENIGLAPLTVVGLAFEPGVDPGLQLGPPSDTRLPPGGAVTFEAAFAPGATPVGLTAAGVATLVAQDPATGATGAVSVDVRARVGGGRLQITPEPLDFGEVAVATSLTRTLIFENVGFDPLRIFEAQGDRLGTGAFTIGPTPTVLAPGERAEVDVTFTPNAGGTIVSAVWVRSDDAVEPEQTSEVRGVGLDIPPCRFGFEPTTVNFGEVRLTETARATLTFRNTGRGECLLRDVRLVPGDPASPFTLEDGPRGPILVPPTGVVVWSLSFAPTAAGLARAQLALYVSDPQQSEVAVELRGVGRPLIEVTCPPSVTTPAGQPVRLAADGDAIGNIVRWAWTIAQAPMGGIGTPNQWQPNPPTAREVVFLPFIVGVYTLQLTIEDDRGNMASCTTDVTAEGRGLRVTLTWDGPGDVDLHVHRGASDPWFGPDDCYYANRSPLWDASWPAADGPNPELDFDNTRADGPENTRINVVQIGETYTIAAHNFSRAAGRRATLQVFCGGGTIPDATLTSRPLQGTTAGNCSDNDFWKAATVVFSNASQCVVTPLDQYVPSGAACAGY